MLNYSEEIINAFVDGELDGPEKEKFKQDMQDNEQLAEKVHLLCGLKKSLKSSYSQIPLPESKDENYAYGVKKNIKFFGVVMLVLCAGYFMGYRVTNTQVNNDLVGQYDIVNGVKLSSVNLQVPNKIILHVSSSDPEALYETFYKIDSILEKYNKNKMPFELEVVANAGGIDLFREDVSPFKNRIKQISEKYNNVSFIACSNAVERLRLKGIEPDLIAEVKTGVTAIEEIVMRLQQGWVYIRV